MGTYYRFPRLDWQDTQVDRTGRFINYRIRFREAWADPVVDAGVVVEGSPAEIEALVRVVLHILVAERGVENSGCLEQGSEICDISCVNSSEGIT